MKHQFTIKHAHLTINYYMTSFRQCLLFWGRQCRISKNLIIYSKKKKRDHLSSGLQHFRPINHSLGLGRGVPLGKERNSVRACEGDVNSHWLATLIAANERNLTFLPSFIFIQPTKPYEPSLSLGLVFHELMGLVGS